MKTRKQLTETEIERFRKTVYDHFREHGRDLPWRHTNDPYCILVSEIMLQQTQVSRMIGKYGLFVGTFPDAVSLDRATLSEVLAVWSGLGYNRRALALKKCARVIVAEHNGVVPSSIKDLEKLPGIGHATAAAICAYAFNLPVVYIETNIRSVFIHHFFDGTDGIHDSVLLPLVEQTLDRSDPRRWYSALMDYGVMLKRSANNPGRRSSAYTKQSAFEGSDRQIRGKILSLLTENSELSEDEIMELLKADRRRVRRILGKLKEEGFVTDNKRGIYRIA